LLAILGSISALAATLPQMISPIPQLDRLQPNGPAVVEAFLKLTISPTGAVERCSPVVVTLTSDTARICSLISAASFTPAKDAAGQPLYSLITAQFHWTSDGAEEKTTMPDVDLTVAHLPSGASVHPIVQTAIIVDADGKIEDCSVVGPSGVQALDNAACRAGLADETPKPIKDKTGAKVRSLQSLSVGFGAYANVILQKDRAYAVLGAAGPYFPERAQRLNIAGSAIIECASDPDGVLSDCTVREEVPQGFGFGQAAKKMAQTKWMKSAPGSGDHVVIEVEFPASGNFRAP